MTYKAGLWKAVCDVCGFEFFSDEMQKRWDGLMVCPVDFEHDHPQKYLRVHADRISVPWVREEPEDSFTYVCYRHGRSAYADLAEADCAKADNVDFSYAYLLELKQGTS